RLMGSFTIKLSETATTWGRAVAAPAEWVARQLWARSSKRSGEGFPPTRLTQQRWRDVKGSEVPALQVKARRPSVCRVCGKEIASDQKYCGSCASSVATERLAKVAAAGRAMGRIAARTPEARTRIAETIRRHNLARGAWKRSGDASPFDEQTY